MEKEERKLEEVKLDEEGEKVKVHPDRTDILAFMIAFFHIFLPIILVFLLLLLLAIFFSYIV
jgi:hypothetical protein